MKQLGPREHFLRCSFLCFPPILPTLCPWLPGPTASHYGCSKPHSPQPPYWLYLTLWACPQDREGSCRTPAPQQSLAAARAPAANHTPLAGVSHKNEYILKSWLKELPFFFFKKTDWFPSTKLPAHKSFKPPFLLILTNILSQVDGTQFSQFPCKHLGWWAKP